MAPEVHFSVERAEREETAVVVEVPHAGLSVDPESLGTLIAPARSIGRDADLYADELFSDAPSCGATLLRAHVSRYVCDLNRAPNELDEQTSPVGTARNAPHGLIWRRTTEGRPALARPLPQEEVARRLALIYEPYHATLRALLEEKRRKFGFAVLLCGHSMPTFGRLGERRADVVPGSRGGTTTAAEVLAATERVAARFSLRLEHDVPYRGGYSTATYGKPAEGVHAVQIELSRSLYMDEASLIRQNPGFATTRAFCKDVVTELGQLSLAPPR